MKLACDGFILRPPKATDLESYHRNVNDPSIGKNMRAFSYPMSRSKAKRFLDSYMKKYQSKESVGLFIDINGECVGAISLSKIEKNHKALVGYWLGKAYRGKGIMTAALKKITEYGFKRYKLRRIFAYVAIFNKPSSKLLEKCGYKFEGVLKKNRLKNGKYYDDCLYAITR